MLSCIDLQAGGLLWSFAVRHPRWARVPAVRLPGLGTLCGSYVGRLYLVDASGERLAAATVAQRVSSHLGAIDDGTVVFETKGAVTALRVNLVP